MVNITTQLIDAKTNENKMTMHSNIYVVLDIRWEDSFLKWEYVLRIRSGDQPSVVC